MRFIKAVVWCFAFLLIAVFVASIIPDKDKRQMSAALRGATEDPAHPDIKDAVLKDTKLDFHWNKSGFGTVMTADFKLKNPTPYRFKDFEITCTNFGASGTELDSNKRVIYEIVEPKSTKSLRHVNMGFIHTQAASTSCELTDVAVEPSPKP